MTGLRRERGKGWREHLSYRPVVKGGKKTDKGDRRHWGQSCRDRKVELPPSLLAHQGRKERAVTMTYDWAEKTVTKCYFVVGGEKNGKGRIRKGGEVDGPNLRRMGGETP